MAISYPVIRITVIDRKMAFCILPIHLPFLMNDPTVRPETSPDIANRAMHDWMQFDDSFRSAILSQAYTPTAVKFRALLRSSLIRDAVSTHENQ